LKYLVAAFAAAGALSALPALAQTPVTSPSPVPSGSPSPTPDPAPTKEWQPSGFAAVQFPNVYGANSFLFSNGTNSRTFETANQQPIFNALNLQLVKNGAIGGKVELTAGSNANVIASYPWNVDSFDVTQLYASFASGQFTLIGGKFETLAGAEVIEDPNDTNISRSILFGFAVPFTHTGARLTFSPFSQFSAIVGVDNGWDNLKGAGAGLDTVEYAFAYNSPAFSLTAQGYSGVERISNTAWSQTGNSPTGYRGVIDLVGTYRINPKLTFVVNYDHGQQLNAPLLNGAGAPEVGPFGTPAFGTATWEGTAGYLTYQFSQHWIVSARAETFQDFGGYRTGFTQNWREATLTVGYAFSPQLLLRIEGRGDVSNQPVWKSSSAQLRNSLQSVEAQALVKF
jgi:hypothetical protein